MAEFYDDLRTQHIDIARKERVTTRFQWAHDEEETDVSDVAKAIISYLSQSLTPPESGEVGSKMREQIQPVVAALTLPAIKELMTHELIPEGTMHYLIGSSGLRHTMVLCAMMGVVIHTMLTKQKLDVTIEREELDDDDIEEIMKQEEMTRLLAFFESIGIDPEEGLKRLNEEIQQSASSDRSIFDLANLKNELKN